MEVFPTLEEQPHHPPPPLFPQWVTVLLSLLHPTGYFIHDTLDIIFNHQSRSSWEYLVHHAMVSTASTGGYHTLWGSAHPGFLGYGGASWSPSLCLTLAAR